MSLMSSSLLLQQCPTCLVCLIWMVLEMGCYFQDLFNIARSILVQFPSSFFSICLVSIHLVELTQSLLERNCVLFYRISQTFSQFGGASGVMVIVAGIGHGNTSSNPGLIAFHIALIPLGKV